MKIAIVVGSVREDRVGDQVGNWFEEFANARGDENVTYEVVDVKKYDLPLLGTTPSAQQVEAIGAWSKKMAEFDGYVFVTPEYNRVVPGAFKNALDYLQPELHNKAVGYVGYGGLGGLSSIQSLRLINAEQELASVRTMVTLSLLTDFENMSVLKPAEYHNVNANKMLDQLLSWSKALQTVRTNG